jgi:hypothetical protein
MGEALHTYGFVNNQTCNFYIIPCVLKDSTSMLEDTEKLIHTNVSDSQSILSHSCLNNYFRDKKKEKENGFML